METEKAVEQTNDVKPPEVNTTPTPEQQLETLRAEIKAKDEAVQKANASIQGLRGSLQAKDKEIKEQSSLRDELNTQRETLKVLAAMLAEKDGITDEANPEKKSEYLKKFNEIEEKQKQKEIEAKKEAEQEQFAEVIIGYQKRVEALGLTENDEDYLTIQELVISGNPISMKRAEIKLNKLEKEKKTVAETKPNEKLETLEKKIAEQEAELKKYKGGGLEVETGKPGGVIRELTAEILEKMSPDERWARRKEIKNMQLIPPK